MDHPGVGMAGPQKIPLHQKPRRSRNDSVRLVRPAFSRVRVGVGVQARRIESVSGHLLGLGLGRRIECVSDHLPHGVQGRVKARVSVRVYLRTSQTAFRVALSDTKAESLSSNG